MKVILNTADYTEEVGETGEPVRKYPEIQKAIFEMVAKTGVPSFVRPLKLLAKSGSNCI